MARFNRLKLKSESTRLATYWGWTTLAESDFKGTLRQRALERACFAIKKKELLGLSIFCTELGIEGYFTNNEIKAFFYEVSINYGIVWRNLIKN